MDLKCFRQNMCVANCWRPSSRRIRHTTGTRAAGIFSIYAGLRRWLPDGMSVRVASPKPTSGQRRRESVLGCNFRRARYV